VHFSYPRGPALLEDFDLDVAGNGHVTCLLGPSGIGKSTLLMLALGELQPLAGEISRIGSCLPVLQDYQRMLLPWFVARRNIVWGLDEVPRHTLGEVADLLEIAGTLDALPRELSGGQCQRVVLARALIRTPSLLLLDEPLANLDVGTSRRVLPRLRSFLRAHGVSAFWVTHNLSEALHAADVVCVLHLDGGVRQFPVTAEGGSRELIRELEELLK
jgi:ABC-type nitrate/sulfonate/bicarbonate transport system ATPase subunit